ncbi:DNA polymerase III, alpha subunit [Serpentinimonas raichei]|uniref:DNA polymerase III subunit alpha n=1 Tax=Serpentinimonas raichei TaxID=1458425 RepID=A0A060NR75_9BURK|nr:DNA polymerase III subunit alpha [Serpentinimonas raichei]BAO81394.1 DNA polymerase III, alpha subunit [Serpentinimonas raichei]
MSDLPDSPAAPAFVHLRLHTEFSVVDGTTRIDAVAAAAAADGQPALAITDLNNLFGAVKFYQAARSQGVQPILGAEVLLQGLGPPPAAGAGSAAPPIWPRLLLLAQNHTGYLNLCELLARGWSSNLLRDQGVLKWDWLRQHHEGLIVLSGAAAGPVGQALLAGDEAAAAALAQQLAGTFAQRFYLEVQRAGRADDERHLRATVPLAARLGLPLVATHPVQFLQADDFQAHEARVCIAEGEILGNPRRPRRFTREQYFKTGADMAALFADLPGALAQTLEIARRCSLRLTLGKPQLPAFPIPPVDGQQLGTEDYFRHVAQQGLQQRLQQLYTDAAERARQQERYQERLEFELGTIVKMGFPGYFLIVSDFILWAKAHGCPVGPGRGSGAGSLVAYALQITDLDPLRYQLLFERFLNPERVSMPDFDIDFCQANRDRVIDYVKGKYGLAAVSQIATFGTLAARAAIRDVGRVLDFPYGFCDGISKLIPNKPGQSVTLQYPPRPKPEGDKTLYAIEMEPLLAERIAKEDEVRQLIELAQKLEGLTRNVGMHAGGVLIAPGKLTDFCPLYQQPGSNAAVSQYDKDDVEAIGLVKFDFLGLATLTILEQAKELIVQRHPQQADFAYETLALDDAATYRLFQEGKTEAVFQFESRGMQGMLRDAKPSRLEDLIALNALYRPGPMDLIPSFVARKHGREVVQYPHPLLEQVLSETYGIMVYQEQVMQTAQILGGYSLGGADLLRRAMGKKKPEEMAQQRLVFRQGAAGQGLSPAQADEVFDLMEKFAGYGFNKSHAAAYSLLAYHTAWIKVHYTAEFFCANLTLEMDDTDKLKLLVEDAQRFNITFEPPDVNLGGYRFDPVSAQCIRYGLGAVKGTGQQAIEAIVAARQGHGAGPRATVVGPFSSLFDFCARIERGRLNKRTVEALVKAGAFDRLHPDRAAALASVELAFDFAQAQQANALQGGLFDLPGQAGGHGASDQEPALAEAPPWSVRERLTHEKAALGFYFSGHLFDQAADEVRRIARTPLADVTESREPQLLAGIVGDLRVINGQRGKVALFKLDDRSAVLEASADDALLQAHRHLLQDDELVLLQVLVQPDRFSGGLRLKVQQVWDLPAARCRFGKYLRVAVGPTQRPEVAALLQAHPPRRHQTELGEVLRGLPLRLEVEFETVRATLQLDPQRAQCYPCDAALAAWRTQAHQQRAEVVYD